MNKLYLNPKRLLIIWINLNVISDKMGNCILLGKKILTEEDIEFIAKNTAMDKTQVEVE